MRRAILLPQGARRRDVPMGRKLPISRGDLLTTQQRLPRGNVNDVVLFRAIPLARYLAISKIDPRTLRFYSSYSRRNKKGIFII